MPIFGSLSQSAIARSMCPSSPVIFPPSSKTTEHQLVKCMFRMLQGLSSSTFRWDSIARSFVLCNSATHIPTLSRPTLHSLISRFIHASNCLKLSELLLSKLESRKCGPTLRGFTFASDRLLKRLRSIAVKEEVQVVECSEENISLLGLSNSLSSLCSSAESLFTILNGAVPPDWMNPNFGISAAEISVHLLDYLFKKLDDVCLVQHGEEELCKMLLVIFIGTLLPHIQSIDSWLLEGILDDPFEELFFHANKMISANEPEFWENSYQLRQTAGSKSAANTSEKKLETSENDGVSTNASEPNSSSVQICPQIFKEIAGSVVSAGKSLQLIEHVHEPFKKTEKDSLGGICNTGLTLCEAFLLSLAEFLQNSAHIHSFISQYGFSTNPDSMSSTEMTEWRKLLIKILEQKAHNMPSQAPFIAENPTITVCQNVLPKDLASKEALNLARNFSLPPLNDEPLWKSLLSNETECFSATDYSLGFQYDKLELHRMQNDIKMLESLFPFPTLLPHCQEKGNISDLLPTQKNSTLISRVLDWIQNAELKCIPLPSVIMHECLIVYIKKLVDDVGRNILSKLMKDWRLLDELSVLRAVYLLGSGDLLHHFLTTVFNKLNDGEPPVDDYELNTILQESIRNSSDSMLLTSPHSLVVSIVPTNDAVSTNRFSINNLETLRFEYEAPWPLELIANREAVNKYNHVMKFLLKVKRAKFVLDKTRTWLWKGRGDLRKSKKRQWLVEQKLLHFVDAFHQYVMDRVYHSAWRDLTNGILTAGSLDEVIHVHESYLASIQRQCFVAPDKLCTIIGARVNTILGLALEFHSVRRVLCSSNANAATCDAQINRIENQFDDCVAFLLKVLSPRLNAVLFPHLSDLVTRINYNSFYMNENGSLNISTTATL